jgi:hypothetical protein
MEFEKMTYQSWMEIKTEIERSEALFLFLGENVKYSPYTENWIAFEIGVACANNKDVWIFEQYGDSIEFPAPYLTDYMVYDLSDSEHFNYIRSIIEGYGRSPIILPLGVPQREKKGVPSGDQIQCGYGNCNLTYNLHTRIDEISCPSCRQGLDISNKMRE